jgi:hypothetical protein
MKPLLVDFIYAYETLNKRSLPTLSIAPQPTDILFNINEYKSNQINALSTFFEPKDNIMHYYLNSIFVQKLCWIWEIFLFIIQRSRNEYKEIKGIDWSIAPTQRELIQKIPSIHFTVPGIYEYNNKRAINQFNFGPFLDFQVLSKEQVSKSKIGKEITEFLELNKIVIYINTGSIFGLTKQQNEYVIKNIQELMERSEVSCIFSLRYENESTYKELTNKIKKKYQKRWLLTREFLDQIYILNHNSTRIFVSHWFYK